MRLITILGGLKSTRGQSTEYFILIGAKLLSPVDGFPVVLQFWAYEIVEDIAKLCATSLANGFPRMLNWECKKFMKDVDYEQEVLVVSQMHPRSDVEQKFVESIQCPRPLLVHYDRHNLDTTQALEPHTSDPSSSFHPHRPSSADSDYPASGGDAIAVLDWMEMSLATLITDIESTSKMNVEATSKILDLIQEFEPDFRQFNSEIQSHLPHYHDQHKEVTPRSLKRSRVETDSGIDTTGQQGAEVAYHQAMEAANHQEVRRSSKRLRVKTDLAMDAAGQEEAMEVADHQEDAAGQQASVAVDLERNVRSRKKGCLKTQIAAVNKRNIGWQLTGSQSIKARKQAERKKNVVYEPNLNVDAAAPRKPKSKPRKPKPKSKPSAPRQPKSKP